MCDPPVTSEISQKKSEKYTEVYFEEGKVHFMKHHHKLSD